MRHGIVAGLVVLAGAVLLLALSLPYLPLVHGTTAGEIDRLAAWLELAPGMRVADVGAGDGRFAIALARRVGPAGRVHATEIDPRLLARIREAASAAGLANVTVVEGAVSSTGLPDDCCDASFHRLVYHHLTDPASINTDLRRALRPGGRLLVIDFEPGGIMDWIGRPQAGDRHGGHGTPRTVVVREVTAADFRLARGPEWWRGRMYAVLFTRAPHEGPRIR
jgi:ubiquinone/menaquinone biosynthesis C-methylase UbiE